MIHRVHGTGMPGTSFGNTVSDEYFMLPHILIFIFLDLDVAKSIWTTVCMITVSPTIIRKRVL